MRIRLTTPDGRVFEVNPDFISMIMDAEPGLWASTVKSVVYTSDGKQGVRETIDQIKKLENANEKRSFYRSHKSSREASRQRRLVLSDDEDL